MYLNLQLLNHLFTREPVHQVKGYILVFQPVIDQVIRVDAASQQTLNLLNHSFIKPHTQSLTYTLTSCLTVNKHRRHQRVPDGKGRFIHRMRGIVISYLNSTHRPLDRVNIGTVVQAFIL